MNAKNMRLLPLGLLLVIMLLASALPAQTTHITGASTINQCETKSYTIGVQNNSGNPLTAMQVTAKLSNLTGFSYVAGTTAIDVNGGAAFCTVDPTPSGTDIIWNINAGCGSPFTLADGETLNVTFSLATSCAAVSGSLNVRIDYQIGGTPMFDDTGVHSIQVLPGGITIKKTPNVIPQEIGQNVTWTLNVENTGFGTIKNVVVSDVLGAGLAYVSSSPTGSNSGQATTWGPAAIPGLASMNPGETITMDITATVTACELLDNNADVRWGCDLLTDCFNTVVDGGTATASVQRIVKTPLISYTPANIQFTYCADTVTVNFPVSNIGDGRAHDVQLCLDFSPLTVEAVTAPATYSSGCFIIPSLAAGETFNLEFTLRFDAWCGGFPARDLIWITNYEDDCHNHFYPPVRVSSLSGPAAAPSLSVEKSGAPTDVQIGSQITYTITSSYSGPLTCGTGSTGAITVIDTIPDGFTVQLPIVDGGFWVPGAGGTGGTITWTYTPPASLNTSITLQVPGRDQCETYCNTIFTNNVAATVVDCCGCTLNATASATTAIECQEGVISEKTASGPTQRCADTTYTTSYTFDPTSTVLLTNLIFTEHAENQQVYNNNLSITLDGSDISSSATVSDTTPGGSLVFNFTGGPATPLAGRVLVIRYNLTATAATVAACGASTFYSWSSLSMGVSGSNCLGDGVIHETTPVTIASPAMAVSLSGLGTIIDKCQTQTITMTLNQTSTFNPKDVRLELSGLNYYIVDYANPAAITCSGDVSPVSCTPTMNGSGNYEWTFNDLFSAQNQHATIVMNVQKRCSGSAGLTATAYFDDRCTDDGTSDDLCSAAATETPALLLSGDLLIEKTPEIYYASTNTVEWKIYVTNRGSGSAYNVWLDDVLGAGLDYVSAVVNNITGVTITADQDHLGAASNGCSITINEMTAGQRREITLQALLINCNNLTNNASTSWGCGGTECQTPVSDNSTVAIPQPLLINTNVVTTPADACSSPSGMITLKNAGQTTCYNLQTTVTLPAGLTYVPGTTSWRVNSGAWNGPNAAYDPNPTASPLRWTSAQIPGLASADSSDVIEIKYDMAASCSFAGGNVTLSTQYENPCSQVFTNADSVFTVAFRTPQITLTKTRANQPIGCGELVEWTITVSNTSGYTLPIIWVEDILDAAFTYQSSLGNPPYTSDNGTHVGQAITWELRNVNHGATVTLTLRATSDSSPCSPDLDNTVRAWWGCGAADGSSATKPGQDPPDNSLCLTSIAVSTVRTETRQPSVAFLAIAVNPNSLNSCADATELTVTISNPGPTDASAVDLVVTLPAGLSYIAGSAAVTCGGILADPAPEPTVSGNQLIFYNTGNKSSNLCDLIQAAGGNDTVTLVFSVRSNCYTTATMGFNLYYYDCCGDTQYNTPASQEITALYPVLTVSKTPVSSQVACGADQTWMITVTNTGTGNAEVVRIEDTLGDWIDYISSAPAATLMSGQTYGWEINNLAAGGNASFTITGQLNPDAPQASCAAALRQNNARAIWGCGTSGDATDGNPNTTAYDCSNGTWANAPAATLQMPDLVATAITPSISCISDGTFSGSISVTVRNQGDGIASGAFTVQVIDGNGWTGTGSFAGPLAAGASTTVTIDVTSWNPGCSPCTYNFTATVDSGSAICECNESNNVLGPLAYSPAIPDLEVTSDTLALTCTADGQYRISGTVTLRNGGCSGTLAQDVPMRFTLFSGAGCTGSQIAQWTQIFTGVSIPSGGTQTFTITNYAITGNACTSATGCQFSIRSEADYTNTICECDGSDNTLCSNKTFSIPDLRVASDTLAISCSADGQIRVQGNLVVANDGCGANLVTSIPIRIRIYDGNACSGANGNLTFIQASVNIPAGGTQTFAINRTLNRNLCTLSTGCQVAIGIELDYNNTICECSNANNNYCSPNKIVSIPDLQVSTDTLAVSCLQDGQIQVSGTATIVNTGCNAPVTGNVPIRFTLFSNINCGGAQLAQWTENFAGANIAAGGNQIFTITRRDIITNICSNSAGCQVSLRIEVDPAPSTICECNGTNNSSCTNKTVSIPDLRITTVTPLITCSSDGNLSGTIQVTVNNNGCGAAANIPVRLTSDCGYTFSDQTITTLAAGASTILTFSFTPDISRCTCTFTASVDPDATVCECDGNNNSLISAPYTSPIPDLTVNSIVFSNVACTADHISGTIQVRIDNLGCATATNAVVSLNSDCGLTFSNQTVTVAAGANATATFTISSGSWTSCTAGTCSFTATVDPGSLICEYDGGNNSLTSPLPPAYRLPDLNAVSASASISCLNDGSLSGAIAVTVSNIGPVALSGDFYILVSDGQGWSSELRYNADLGGPLPLNPGDANTVTFNWTRIFTTYPYTCNFPTITATVDSRNNICECTNTDNTITTSYNMAFPDLRIVSVTPTCSADGSYSIAVVVDNIGCGPAVNAVVRLADDDGQSQDQTVSLAAGASTTLTFAPWPADGNPATLTFTATADPGTLICELSGANNSVSTTFTRANLNLLSIIPACNSDGVFQVSLVIRNSGSSPVNSDFVVRLTDNDGHSVDQNFTAIGGTLPLAAGSQQTVVFDPWTVDCDPTTINFTGTLDPTDQVCESNNGDNSDTGTITIDDLQAVSVVPTTSCANDGAITGTMAVTITNSGGNAINNDFSILVNDGQGWTSELLYNADLGGTLPITAGGNATVSIPWTRGFTSAPYVCSFPAISVALDSSNAICECSNGNNGNTGNYSLPFPNLNVVSVTPTCSSDSSYSITVVVNNNGCATATNAVVRLSDDDGHTADQTVTLAAGATQTLTYAPWPADGNPATLTFTTTMDPGSAICELSGTDNTNTTNFTRGNLNLASITPACNSDGTFQVSLIVQNNGSAAINSDFVVRLADNDGHSVDQNFTAIGGTLPLAAGSQQTVVFDPWTVDCDPTTINFTGTLDPTDQVCESNNSDNANTGTITINDLNAVSIVPATSCSSDGAITGTMAVTITNSGGNAINNDFSILINDGQGWTSELLYNADLGGTLPIAVGASQTVTFNWTRNFSATPYVCSFASISATVDSQNAICECTNSNNGATATYSSPYPNLNLVSVTPTCSSDGSYSIAVTVSNNGCATATNAVVRLSDDDGHTTDQTVTLAAGASQTLTYSPWPADGSPAALTFTAVIDPAAAICELTGDDHSEIVTFNNPNLHIVSITPACVADGSYRVTMVIENNGAGDVNSDFVLRLTDNDGHSVDQNFTAIGGTLPLAAGSQQTVVFDPWTVDCDPTTINFTGTLDPTDQVCESNNGDNANTGTITINDLNAVSVVPATSCSSDGAITGTMAVTITNTGGNAINTDFRILVDDGQGWTSELLYNADLGGMLPIAVGTSQTVTFNWTRNFSATPYVCSFPGIRTTVDSQNAICECTNSNNGATATYNLPYPDLAVTSVAAAITCLGDGSLTGTTVTVANTGCVEASGVMVRLNSDCGLTFADQVISLAAGESRDLVFNFTSGIVSCICNFTASIDPDNVICELAGVNNSNTGTLPLSVPDIEVAGDNLQAACSLDGVINVSGTVNLINNGCGPAWTGNIGMRFTLFSEPGCRGTVIDQWTQVLSGVNISSLGGTQNFVVFAREITGDLCSLAPGCQLSVRMEADYDQRICEWDGTNNDHCANVGLSCRDLAFSDVSWQCDPAGAITWTVRVTNSGNSPVDNASVRIYDEAPTMIFEQRVSIASGDTVTLTFTSAAYPVARDHSFRVVIDENNEICECNGTNNVRIVTVNCPFLGEPRLEIKKTCPPAQQPGGIFRFEIEVRNSGAGRIDDVSIEDVLPAPLQYVSGSSAIDGTPAADPSGSTVLTWNIGKMAAGESHILVYSLIAPADTDPGRYCNQAQAFGKALDGRASASEKTACCVILRREAAGCCLIIDERAMGFVQYPEQAIAYIEPYFHTEKAMFTSYAALHLWENIDFEKGSLPDFVRERLKNYALSNVEELYFHSRLGLTLPDGSLWLSYAGNYPQKENSGWKEKNTMRSMTPAQLAFELLAMNKAVPREDKLESRNKLTVLIDKKLDFVAAQASPLPEYWEFTDGKTVRKGEKAALYGQTSLYLALVELGKSGRVEAVAPGRQLRKELELLDNEKFDSRNLRAEFLFILALKENGEDELAAKKIGEFEKQFKAGQAAPEDLSAYAMAVYTDFKAGGILFQALFAEMKNKYYSSDMGLFTQPLADFKHKVGLESLAPLILAFESQMPAEKDLFATTLYRSIEETGLFLKKTNLQVQRPPLNLIKNYPFTQEMLPLLTFIKSYDDMAPIFSETAMVQSPHTAPTSENLLPVTFTKVLAPQYETDTAQIGLLSFSLQHIGQDLDLSAERVTREQGRSLDQSGKKYVRLLLASRAGLAWQGDVFLPEAKLAVKGSRPQELNLEATDSKSEFTTAALANKLIAEKIFLENPGPDRRRLESILEMEKKLLNQFKAAGYVPARFTAFKKSDAGDLVMLPGREKADKMTVAKLHYALPDAFWQQILEKETGTLVAQDLLFLSLAPRELRSYFAHELQQFLSIRARDFSQIAAQVLTRKILGLDETPTRKKLAAVWDHETDLPLSANLENMNRGQVSHYQPWQILIYLMATKDNADFQFKRTLDYFTYLLESEWAMNWSEEYGTLPAAEYWLIKESPREFPEAGDLLNFNVRVENRCPDGLTSAGDLPSLFIKADFTPNLVFAGSELPANLNLFKAFSWGYQGLQKDSYLQFTYQALIPQEFKDNFLQGSIWARGYMGYQPFGPDSAAGEYCENFAQTGRLQLLPQDLIPGLVYADRNANGRKDAGETGIAAIRFKDNRGRLFRSNAEGRFFVPAGQENVAVQIDFRSIPEDLVLVSPPTQLVNSALRRELTYALVPCGRLSGFIYLDDNHNGFYDEGETRLAGIWLTAGDKECGSGANGEFTMNNLPDLWRELLKINDVQPLYTGPLDQVRIHIFK